MKLVFDLNNLEQGEIYLINMLGLHACSSEI